MPGFPVPPGGGDIFYVDESAGSGVFVMACLRVPFLRGDADRKAVVVWPDHYERATSWRRSLSKAHDIRFRAELHGSDLLAGKGQIHKTRRNLNRDEALDLYRGALETLSFLPPASLMATASTDATQLFGQTKMTATLTGLLQRIERQTYYEQTFGLIFFDEGHAEYAVALRKAQKYLPVGSALGGWHGGKATVNKPLKVIIEDGNQKTSETSYLVQIADLVAYATLQKIKGECGLLSPRRIALGHHQLFDRIPKRVLNTRVQPARGDGIAII